MSNESDYQIPSSDNSESNESQDFQSLMDTYQKEMKSSKKQNLQIPKEISTMMGEANHYFMFNDFQQTQEILRNIIRQYPNYSEPYHLLGLMEEQKKNLSKAAHFYTLAAELSQGDSELWSKIGYFYKETELFDQAQYCFGRALKKDPLNSIIIQERGKCFEQLNDYKKAIKQYVKLLQLDPENPTLVKLCAKVNLQSQTYAKNKQYDKTKELLIPLIHQNNTVDFNVLNMVVELFILCQDYQNCIQYLTTIEQTVQLPLEICVNLGICYSKIDDMKNAIIYFQKIYQYDALKYQDLYTKCLEVLESKSQFSVAIEFCDHLLSAQNYSNIDTLMKIGMLHQKIGDYESALDTYKMVIHKNPNQFEAQQYICDIYQKLGDLEQAYTIFENNYKQENQDQEEIYMSSDEEGKIEQKVRAKVEVVREFKEDQVYKKVKIESEVIFPYGKNKLRDTVDSEIDHIKQKYNYEQLHFVYKQSIFSLFNTENQIETQIHHIDLQFIDKIFHNLIHILSLENDISKLRKNVLNRYLYESRKKGFTKSLKSQSVPVGNNSQNILKKNKCDADYSVFLKKKKIKISQNLTNQHLEHVSYISKSEGEFSFLDYILKVNSQKKFIEILNQHSLFKQITKVCWNTYKLDYLKDHPQHYTQILTFGTVNSLKLGKFENAFQYFKQKVKKYPNSVGIVTIFAHIIYNIEDQDVYRTFLSKLGIRQDRSNLATQQLTGYNYLNHSYFDLAIQKFRIIYNQDPQNSLICLMLGVAYLQSAISRSADDRKELLQQAFNFFYEYKQARQNSNLPETLYNMGRAFAQISYHSQALEFFEQCILESGGEQRYRGLCKKAAYNLFYIHKQMGNLDICRKISEHYL